MSSNDNRDQATIDLARLLVERMERLSPDSIWARRSSGYRGALLKVVTRLESDHEGSLTTREQDLLYLERVIPIGFALLERAAGGMERCGSLG